MTTSAHTKLDLTGLQAHFKHQTPATPPKPVTPPKPAVRMAFLYEFRDAMPRIETVMVSADDLTGPPGPVKVSKSGTEWKVHSSSLFLTAAECGAYAKKKATMHYLSMLDKITSDIGSLV